MEKRKLGNSGFEIAPLAFGGNVFGWTVDETASFELLDAITRCRLHVPILEFVYFVKNVPYFPGRSIPQTVCYLE